MGRAPLLVAAIFCLAVAWPLSGQRDGRGDGARSTSAPPEPGGRGRGQRGGRGAEQALPKGTTAHRDLLYVTNGHVRQTLDLYLPRSTKKTPLVVMIHGGGFRSGDKGGMNPTPFLSDGYAAASINYRLSGDAIFPAQIEDCKAAVRWLRRHADQYNLDPERIAVWGTSAGGHLAAMLGTTGDIRIFDVGEHLDVSSRVQAVADWFGPTDLLQMDDQRLEGGMSHNGARSPEGKLIGGALPQNKEKAARANPIVYVTPGDSPFLIAHGDADLMVPYQQSVLLDAALRKAGVPVTFITIKGGGHGFRNESADEKRRQFFARYLK